VATIDRSAHSRGVGVRRKRPAPASLCALSPGAREAGLLGLEGQLDLTAEDFFSRHQVGHSVTNVNCDAGCSAMRRAASASASAFVAKVASGQGQYAVVASNEMTRQLAACSPSVNRCLPQARADCSAVACRPDVGNRTLVVHLAGNE
jgi:hypothetical protein